MQRSNKGISHKRRFLVVWANKLSERRALKRRISTVASEAGVFAGRLSGADLGGKGLVKKYTVKLHANVHQSISRISVLRRSNRLDEDIFSRCELDSMVNRSVSSPDSGFHRWECSKVFDEVSNPFGFPSGSSSKFPFRVPAVVNGMHEFFGSPVKVAATISTLGSFEMR